MKLLSLTSFLIILLLNYGLSQSKGGRWQFENNNVDSADWDMSEDTGILLGSASYGQDMPLREGSSYLWLDSTLSNNFVKIEDSDDLDFMDENIGLSAWIYPLISNETQFFINKGVQNTNPKTTNYSLRISNTNHLEFLIRDLNNSAKKVASSFTIPLDQWSFAAVYYDFSAQKVYMWNDPSSDAVDSLDFNHSYFANDGPLGIGAWYANDENNPAVASFKGRIDDVRISGHLDDIFPKQLTGLKGFQISEITSFQLRQNYPNPFNPRTIISFYLPRLTNVSLKIYDNQGRMVESLLDQQLMKGTHESKWDGSPYASGIYYYQLKAAHFTQTKKMIYMK